MVLDFVESRVTNPVRVVDWGRVEEGQAAVCPCCGWSGRLGECATSPIEDARTYSCGQCAMVLVVRAYPKVIPFRYVNAVVRREERDECAVNE